MNKIFSVLLLVTFSFGIISCSSEDPSSATSQLGQVLDQPNSTDDRNSTDLPDITLDNCYLIDNSTIDNSTVDTSSIKDNSSIKDSTVKNCSTVTRSIVDNTSTVDNTATIDNSTISYSTINNSKVCNSTIDNSTVYNSNLCPENSFPFSIVDQTIDNQTMTEQTDPTVSSIAITSATGIQNSLLNAGDNVLVTATFSESIIVDNTSGTPTLNIVVDTAGDGADVADSRTATYVSDDNSTTLVFQYTIQPGDNDTNGISIGANALALNSGTIRDASGNYATITHSPVDNNSSYMADTTAPTLVDNVSITSASSGAGCPASFCNENDVLSVTATFNDNVTVTGIPELYIFIVNDNRTATYDSGNQTTALIFQYTIQDDTTDPQDLNGISIRDNALARVNNSTIRDLAGNDATITHISSGDDLNNIKYRTK